MGRGGGIGTSSMNSFDVVKFAGELEGGGSSGEWTGE